ncbi:hypothetical protein V6574_12915 [Streptomyces sp. SM1P]
MPRAARRPGRRPAARRLQTGRRGDAERPGTKKDSVPLGPGFTGWALPDRAEVTLPTGCAVRMGSAAPHIRASLDVPSQDEERLYRRGEKPPVDPDTATRNNATVMREVATRLAERYGCAA